MIIKKGLSKKQIANNNKLSVRGVQKIITKYIMRKSIIKKKNAKSDFWKH